MLVEAFATVKSACKRLCGSEIEVTGSKMTWNMVPYDVQLIGGMVLHYGNIAEMQTGEGKTLVAAMPLYLNALTGRNCQLVTVNDYLPCVTRNGSVRFCAGSGLPSVACRIICHLPNAARCTNVM